MSEYKCVCVCMYVCVLFCRPYKAYRQGLCVMVPYAVLEETFSGEDEYACVCMRVCVCM